MTVSTVDCPHFYALLKYTIMAITVIGFFNKRSEATDAVTELTGSGFYRNDIDISYGYLTTKESPAMNDSGVEDDKEHKGNAITRFFNSLFGDNSADAKKYSTISHKADSIVTVHAGSREQAEEAANILDACGAMDIDEGSLVSETYSDSMDMEANRESTGVGLTQEDLLAAGLSAEEIKSIEGIADHSLQNKVRTKSRIFDRKIDEDLRLREEHERLHRKD